MSSKKARRRLLVIVSFLLLLGSCRPSAISTPGDSERKHSLIGNQVPDLKKEKLVGTWERPWPPGKGRLLLVDFWASWCHMCGESLASLGAVSKEFGTQVEVLGISIDEDRKAFENFVKEHESGVPLLWNEDQSLAAAYRVQQLPVIFLVAQDGVVQAVLEGYGPGHDERLRRLIDANLNQNSLQ